MSNTCKNMGLRFKLDLRILILREDETVVDGATRGIARKATKAKIYAEGLKPVLATKYHLNTFLKSLRYISEKGITSVHMPIVQVMGLEAKVSSLRLIGKKRIHNGGSTFVQISPNIRAVEIRRARIFDQWPYSD